MSETAIIAVHGGVAAARAVLPYDRRSGKYRCPACAGPSSIFLSDRYGGDGDVRRIGLTCWTGCSTAAIHAAAIATLPIHHSERRRGGDPGPFRPPRIKPRPIDPWEERELAARIETANLIWDAAAPADGTPAHLYLASRRIWPGSAAGGPPIPRAVRFLSRGAAPAKSRKWAGLPATAAIDGAIVYAHAAPDGDIKAVSLDALTAAGRLPPMRWRRTFGRLVGSAFRIGTDQDRDVICVTEGPLDALALYWMRSDAHIFAAGGANRLASADLAAELARSGKLIEIEPDGDRVGIKAAWTLYRRLPAETRINWRAAGASDPAAEWNTAFGGEVDRLVEAGQTPISASRAIWARCLALREAGQSIGRERMAADR